MLFFPWRNVRFAVVLVEVVIAATTFLYYRSGHRAPSEDQFSLEVDSETPQEPPHPQSQWTIGEVQRPPPYQIDDAGAPWETSKYVNGPPTDNFRGMITFLVVSIAPIVDYCPHKTTSEVMFFMLHLGTTRASVSSTRGSWYEAVTD